MNSKIKEAWVNALRSGNYEQDRERLRSVNGYCCLGVLCDIYAKEHHVEWKFVGIEEKNPQPMDYWFFQGKSEMLPENVIDWAELESENPHVKIYEHEDDEYVWDTIANVNDTGYTFSEIADIIQNQL